MASGERARVQSVGRGGGAAIALAGVVVCGATVAAAAPGGSSTISGCYHATTGQLRVIDPALGQACHKTESPISWPSGASVPDLPDGSVTEAKLADGAVTGPKLADGAVTGPKLADGAVTGPKLAEATVAGSKLVDATVNAAKIAPGAVTTDKLTANVAAGTGGASIGTGTTEAVASATLDSGAGHRVLLAGQVQLTCAACVGPGETATVSWQVYDGADPVGPSYQEQLSSFDPSTVAVVSTLLPSTGAGSRSYSLRVSATTSAGVVTATHGSLTVVDLGQ